MVRFGLVVPYAARSTDRFARVLVFVGPARRRRRRRQHTHTLPVTVPSHPFRRSRENFLAATAAEGVTHNNNSVYEHTSSRTNDREIFDFSIVLVRVNAPRAGVLIFRRDLIGFFLSLLFRATSIIDKTRPNKNGATNTHKYDSEFTQI